MAVSTIIMVTLSGCLTYADISRSVVKYRFNRNVPRNVVVPLEPLENGARVPAMTTGKSVLPINFTR